MLPVSVRVDSDETGLAAVLALSKTFRRAAGGKDRLLSKDDRTPSVWLRDFIGDLEIYLSASSISGKCSVVVCVPTEWPGRFDKLFGRRREEELAALADEILNSVPAAWSD